MAQSQIERPECCPHCGKNVKVSRYGFNINKVQIWKCYSCGRRFIDPNQRVQEHHFKRAKSIQLETLPFIDCANLLKQFSKKPSTIDSLYLNNVVCPCFCCELERKCDPNSCDDLTRWLSEGEQ